MTQQPEKTIQDSYNEIFEMNSAIVDFSRKKVVDLRGVAELHREIADKYDEIADTVAEMALTSAEMIARGIAIETGLYEPDEDDDDDE